MGAFRCLIHAPKNHSHRRGRLAMQRVMCAGALAQVVVGALAWTTPLCLSSCRHSAIRPQELSGTVVAALAGFGRLGEIEITATVHKVDGVLLADLALARRHEPSGQPLRASDFDVHLVTADSGHISPRRCLEEGLVNEIGMGSVSTGRISFRFGGQYDLRTIVEVFVVFKGEGKSIRLHRRAAVPMANVQSSTPS